MGGPGYLTLDQGLAARSVKITEISEGGSVPELKLQNLGDKPLLLIDGEEMVGAKQNRVTNLTVMTGAGATIVIPVSCVEAGRWQHTSAEFEASPQTMHASGRRGKMAGENRIRIRYGKYASPWIDYLLLSPAELGDLLAHTDWVSAQCLEFSDRYLAVIERGESR